MSLSKGQSPWSSIRSARRAASILASLPAGTAPNLMPGERRFVLPVVQKAERPALFHQAPEPRGAEPVGFGFGEWPMAPIGESQTRPQDRVGRTVDDALEASDEGNSHGSLWHNRCGTTRPGNSAAGEISVISCSRLALAAPGRAPMSARGISRQAALRLLRAELCSPLRARSPAPASSPTIRAVSTSAAARRCCAPRSPPPCGYPLERPAACRG
jgi:hypothetical protein